VAVSFIVGETGVPGENHRPVASFKKSLKISEAVNRRTDNIIAKKYKQ